MPISRAQYSRKATRDLRSSMAAALARHVAGVDFFNSAGVFRFAEVFDEWPSYLSRYVRPSACVLPSSWKYGDALMTPHLLEDTWEVKGEPGFGLYKLSELEADFELSLRANSPAERDQIILGLETTFVVPGVLMDDQAGPRYGVFLEMPEYYGVCGRFSLTEARVIDDEERAIREQRDAVLVISAQATQVKVGPVNPLDLRVRITTC